MTNSMSFNPKKYIIEKAKFLPYERCLINEGYSEKGLTQILIIKKQPSGKFVLGAFLLDRLCLGLKNTFGNCNLTAEDVAEIMNRSQISNKDAITPEYANNLIFGNIDYAQELGFKPAKDFSLTKHILNEELITDQIDEIEFGWNGKPFFINGPEDNAKQITAVLDKSTGKGNYEVIILG